MAASQITRATWTDDDGSGTTGTIVTNAIKNSDIYAKIDEMFAGAGSYATFTFGGLVAAEGAGVHSFAAIIAGTQAVRVRNSSTGTGSMASLDAGNSSSATHTRLLALSTLYTTSGYLVADGSVQEANGAGGLSIATTHASGVLRFYTGASITERMRITAAGLMGIGCSPSVDLELRSTADDLSAGFKISRADATYFIMNVNDGGSTAYGILQVGDSGTYRPIYLNPYGSQVGFGDGATATPSIAFSNDMDCGLWYSAPASVPKVSLSVGGWEVVRFEMENAIQRPVLRIVGNANSTDHCPKLHVERQSGGSTAPGCVALEAKNGTVYYLWVDTTGDLRVGTTEPKVTVGDTGGTVVGTQT